MNEDDEFREMEIESGHGFDLCYSVRERGGVPAEVRFGIAGKWLKLMSCRHGDRMRLEISTRSGRCRLRRVANGAPVMRGVQKLKMKHSTGRGELVVVWRGEVEKYLPDTQKLTKELRVIACDGVTGLMFEVPEREQLERVNAAMDNQRGGVQKHAAAFCDLRTPVNRKV